MKEKQVEVKILSLLKNILLIFFSIFFLLKYIYIHIFIYIYIKINKIICNDVHNIKE